VRSCQEAGGRARDVLGALENLVYFVGAAANTELTGDVCGERRIRSD
jgi:hypothetical protein